MKTARKDTNTQPQTNTKANQKSSDVARTVEEILITETTDPTTHTRNIDLRVHNPFGKSGIIDQIRRFMGQYIDSDGVNHKRYEITTYTESAVPIIIEIDQKETDPHYHTGPSLENWPSVNVASQPSHKIDPLFRALLAETKVNEICMPSGQVLVCDEVDTLLDVYKRLITNNILSLPVCSTDKSRFYGFIDILDIVSYLTNNITSPRGDDQVVEPWYSIVDITSTNCRKIMNYSGRDPTLVIDINDSIQSVIDHASFLNYHRIAIMKNGVAESILTQTRLLGYLYKRNMSGYMGTLGSQTVGDLRLGIRAVHTVTNGTQVLQAFKKMVKEKISGLAIVDERNRLIGNLSASDLKLIGYDMELYAKLFGTVADFVKRKQASSQTPKEQIIVKLSTKFTEVLELFQKNKVHRIYVVDGDLLLGVITIGDILSCFQSPYLSDWNNRHFRLS